jgi:hypothetical protein
MDIWISKPVNAYARRQIAIIILIICFLFILPFYPASAQDNIDNSIPAPYGKTLVLQPGIGLRYSVNNKIKLYQDFRTYFYQNTFSGNFEELSFSASYNLGRINNFYFTTNLGYLLTLDNNYKIRAYRPKVYFTTSYHLNKIRLEFRNRLEYIIATGDNRGGSFRYRPRFLVQTTFKLNQLRLSPYVYNESFLGQNGFSQNRTKLALSVRYHDFVLNPGYTLKIKPGTKLVENRVSLDLSYNIPTFTKKKQTR